MREELTTLHVQGMMDMHAGGTNAALPPSPPPDAQDLRWSRQKLAVMAAHATLGLFKKARKARSAHLEPWVSGRLEGDAPQGAPATLLHLCPSCFARTWAHS